VGDMPAIAQGQVESEDRLARSANRLLVCDTELLTTALWHERYWGWCPEEISHVAYERLAHYCLFLLCDNATPWVGDGLRDSPGHREWFQQRFLQELERRQRLVVVLSGSYEERTAEAVRAVEAVNH
jgi:HTH-type transcriptional regulator, transcriptional repressor of NAD biosynthesis genes